MKVYAELKQGSDRWLDVREGKLTGSGAKTLMTAKGKAATGKGIDTLVAKVAAEAVFGRYQGEDYTQWMERGNLLEDEARDSLAFEIGEDIQQVGFVEIDEGPLAGRVGVSPDGLTDGALVEIKCLGERNAVRAFLYPDDFVEEFTFQIQMGMMVCEREQAHLYSFCPGKPSKHIVVPADAEYQKTLRSQLEWAMKEIDEAVKRLRASMDPEDLVAQELFK